MHPMGQYVAGRTFLHHLDPRVKILSTVALSLLILWGRPLSLSSLSGLLLLAVLLSGLPMRLLYEAVRPTALFLLLLFLLHLLFTPGRAIPPFPILGVSVTREGLSGGILITWRFALLLMWAAILTITTSPGEMVGAIERILRPFRRLGVPSHDLALMISMAFRFVPLLRGEIEKVKTAQLARGAEPAGGSLRNRSRALSRLMLPVIAGTMRRADRLAIAIEARGYSGGPRTSLREMRISSADYKAMAAIAGMVVIYCLWG